MLNEGRFAVDEGPLGAKLAKAAGSSSSTALSGASSSSSSSTALSGAVANKSSSSTSQNANALTATEAKAVDLVADVKLQSEAAVEEAKKYTRSKKELWEEIKTFAYRFIGVEEDLKKGTLSLGKESGIKDITERAAGDGSFNKNKGGIFKHTLDNAIAASAFGTETQK